MPNRNTKKQRLNHYEQNTYSLPVNAPVQSETNNTIRETTYEVGIQPESCSNTDSYGPCPLTHADTLVIDTDNHAISTQIGSHAVSNSLSVSRSLQPRVSKRLAFFKKKLCSPPTNIAQQQQKPGLDHTDTRFLEGNGPLSCSDQREHEALHGGKESTSASTSQAQPTTYLDLGDCDQICEFCHATFWYAERLKSHPQKHRPRYSRCCRGDRARLPIPREPPQIIKELFRDKHFMENIRAYNMMFAMTSFGAKVDESINNGSGPYVFKVEGQISHWIGSLCPTTDHNPRFLQMYIYDTANEVCNRLRFFSGGQHGDLNPEIVKTLISILDEFNDLVKLFRTARDMCLLEDPPEFSIRLYNSGNQTRYNTPAQGTLGAIVYDNGPTGGNDFDVILRLREGPP